MSHLQIFAEGHENHAYEEDEMAKKEQEDGKKGFCSKFTRGIRGARLRKIICVISFVN